MEKTEMMKRYEAEMGESLEEARERRKTFAFYSRYIAWLEAQLTWRPASEVPEKDQIVIATYLNSCGKRRRVRAVYIRQYEEESDYDYDSDYEYNEENDTYYLKEGWYELIDNWADYSSVAIVEGVVDYWMPMPPTPEGRGEMTELMSGGKKTLKEIANFLGNPVAVDREGRLLWFPRKPEIGLVTWIWYDEQFGCFGEELPKNLIDFNGDWKDSLTLPDGWEE